MQGATDTLTTARLLVRRFTADDLERLDRLNSDPQVMLYSGGPSSRKDTEDMLAERILAYYAANPGLGVWATIERSSGDFIGMHLLNNIRGEEYIQVGYRLLPQYWGRGYGTEMCVALLRYGFAQMKLPRIVAITDPLNLASQRVLTKSGLLRNGERSFAHPAYARFGPQAWFERDAAAWLAQHPA